ncbi:hypothetical protein [Methyloglobulus sp.]|uniref:hypothetical protein n=1 Tax=Methyloglobulus sp. TaxID=2518622 RepID=UPI0032B871CD
MVVSLFLIINWIPSEAESIQYYAKQCNKIAGISINDFSCEDGKEIPIETKKNKDNLSQPCNNPSLLGKGNPCMTGSKLGMLTFNDDAIVIFICRKFNDSRATDGLYDEVAIIQHNKKSGATCWYQSDLKPSAPIPPNIKSPKDSDFVDEKNQIKWELPSNLEKHAKCVNCHTNDPFVGTPYIKNILEDFLRKNKYTYEDRIQGAYWSPYLEWNNLKHVEFLKESSGKQCTSCHRIALNPANENTCQRFLSESLGLKDETHPNIPRINAFMPPHNRDNLTIEKAKKILADIKSCCQEPDGERCKVSELNQKD